MSLVKNFSNGLLKENPTLVQVVGMCPVLAVTTSIENGVGMGIAATFVLTGSNIVVSLLRKFIPSKVRIPAFVVIIASFVSIIEMLTKAYFPALSASLGIFIPLIVVNCIILARAEAFAYKNGVVRSVADGLGMGLGFTMALLIIASIRELLGNGTLLGHYVFGSGFEPAIIMILPPGAFLTLGIVLALKNLFSQLVSAKQSRN